MREKNSSARFRSRCLTGQNCPRTALQSLRLWLRDVRYESQRMEVSRQRRTELDIGHQVGHWESPPPRGPWLFTTRYNILCKIQPSVPSALLPTGTDFQQSAGKIPSPGRLIYNLSVRPGLVIVVGERERERERGSNWPEMRRCRQMLD